MSNEHTSGPGPKQIAAGVGVAVAVALAAFAVWYWGLVPPIEQCNRLATSAERDDCRLAVASKDGVPMDEIRATIDLVEDPESRDIVRLRLISLDPANADALCPAVEGPRAKEWCQRIQLRPHLETPDR